MPSVDSRKIAKDLIASIRDEIDSIDAAILDLFSQRTELCAQIVKLKRSNFIPPISGSREAHVFGRYFGSFANTTKKMWFAVFGKARREMNE